MAAEPIIDVRDSSRRPEGDRTWRPQGMSIHPWVRVSRPDVERNRRRFTPKKSGRGFGITEFGKRGDPVVISLAGTFGAHDSMWHMNWLWARRGYNVFGVSIAGTNGSDRVRERSLDAFVEDFMFKIDHIKGLDGVKEGPVAVSGYSAAAWIVFGAAAQHPEEFCAVRSLGGKVGEPYWEFAKHQIDFWRDAYKVLRAQYDDGLGTFAANIGRYGWQTNQLVLAMTKNPLLIDEMRKIDASGIDTTIVRFTTDGVARHTATDTQIREMPHARVEDIECGHEGPMKRPLEVLDAVSIGLADSFVPIDLRDGAVTAEQLHAD